MNKKLLGILVAVVVLAVIGGVMYTQMGQKGTTPSKDDTGAVSSTPKSSPLTGGAVADVVEPTAVEGNGVIKELLDADVEYTITANEMKFTPFVLNAKKGQRVRFHVTAEDRTYGFEVAEFHFKDTVYKGETKTMDIVPDKYGTFIFFSRREWNDGKIGELGRLVVTLN